MALLMRDVWRDSGGLASALRCCQGSGTQSFTWDTRNRLSAAAAAPAFGGTAESYVYDGLSRRQSVTAGSLQTNFVYDGLSPALHVATTSGTVSDVINLTVGLGLDERYQIQDTAHVSAGNTNGTDDVLTDTQGSTLALYHNLTNDVAYTYPAFGSGGNPSTIYTNAYRYTGREASDNTGLTYYRARYYNPAWGR